MQESLLCIEEKFSTFFFCVGQEKHARKICFCSYTYLYLHQSTNQQQKLLFKSLLHCKRMYFLFLLLFIFFLLRFLLLIYGISNSPLYTIDILRFFTSFFSSYRFWIFCFSFFLYAHVVELFIQFIIPDSNDNKTFIIISQKSHTTFKLQSMHSIALWHRHSN